MSSQKTCFIASTIGEENSEERKIADEKFDLVFEPVLKELGYAAIRADKIGTPNSISYDIVKAILESDLMIADVSDVNPNVFYELAVRNSIQKPVIVIKGKNQKMPFDIYDKRAISIDMTVARLWVEAKNHLKKQISEAEKDKESASKSILTDFSLNPNLQSHLSPSDELSLEMKDIKSEIRRLREDVRETDARRIQRERGDIWVQDTLQDSSSIRIVPPYMPLPDRKNWKRILFTDVLRSLEGDQKKPVKEADLISELIKTQKFNTASSKDWIRSMLLEAEIYESRPKHYNFI